MPEITAVYQYLDARVTDAYYSTDEFRMFGFKILPCPKTRSHDWTECPLSHRGEKARRRDPSVFEYMAIACPNYKANKGECPSGDNCWFAHGIFEYWLHPAKYRTRPCNMGLLCRRKVCFFAHGKEQLRTEIKYRVHWSKENGSSDKSSDRVTQITDSATIPDFATRSFNPEVSTRARLPLLVNPQANVFGSAKKLDKGQPNFPEIDWISELLD